MTGPVSLLAPQSGAYLPAPSVDGLTDAETSLMLGLSTKLSVQTPVMMLRDQYYRGEQVLQNLGISVPPVLSGVRTVVDWPRICVDPILPRAVVDGFRTPGSTDVDSELAQHWAANDLDGEASLCFLDSLVFGRGYMVVGSPDEPGDSPIVTVESPFNLTTTWDPRTRQVTAAYQAYQVEGVYRAVLYLPNQTITMSRVEGAAWAIDNRDVHNFGTVPVVRFLNRARSVQREGWSEITPAIMATTDSACRTLLGMEIAREFYSIPHKYGLGLKEEDFLNPDGTRKSQMDMAVNRFLAFERDDAGELPVLGQFKTMDPAVFTKIIDEHAQLMASYTGFPPSYFGQTTTANPASADAIRTAENGLVARAEAAQRQWSGPLQQTMRLVWRFANRGEQVPDDIKHLETDWDSAATPTPAATSDAITKQIAAGAVPATSDVTLSRLGYSAVERARLEQDREKDPAQQLLEELGTDVAGKDVIAALRLLKATGQPVPQPDAVPAPGAATAPPAAPVPPPATR